MTVEIEVPVYRKFKWGQPMNERSRRLVAQMDPACWQAARRYVPYELKRDDVAIETGYMEAFKCLVRSAANYSDERGCGFCTYCYKSLGRTVRSYWRQPGRVERFIRFRSYGAVDNSEAEFIFDNIEGDDGLIIEQPISPPVEKAIAMLEKHSPKMAFVIRGMFGFDGVEFGPVEMAQKMGISRERVRQLRNRGIEVLREHLKNTL